MSERVHLQRLDPEEDPSIDEYFDVLSDAIQHDSRISMNVAVQQLIDIISRVVINAEIINFVDTCFEVAEQIHYNHPSQSKLVTLIDLVLNSPKITGPMDDIDDPQERHDRTYNLSARASMDWWNSSKPSYGIAAYMNYQTFDARIHERGMLSGTHTAKYVCSDAFGELGRKAASDELEAYVVAACQWILILGDRIYRDVLGVGDGDFSPPTHKQWRMWRGELQIVAFDKLDSRYAGFRHEVRLLAGNAVEEMHAIELKMGAPSEMDVLCQMGASSKKNSSGSRHRCCIL